MTDAVFTALADPTRRRVIESLASRDSATATSLAAELPISRQAVTKHLGALRAAELVSVERLGREVHYRLDPRPLDDAASWIERVGSEWDARLDDLEQLIQSRRDRGST